MKNKTYIFTVIFSLMITLPVFAANHKIYKIASLNSNKEFKIFNRNNKVSANTTFTEELKNYNKKVASEMTNAISEGKLVVPDYIKSNIKELAAKGYCLNGYQLIKVRTYASKGLLDLIHNLLNSNEISSSNPLSILSFIRRGRNHGAIQSNGDAICRAVDIDHFSGNRINMENPQNSLKAIIKVIENLPEGKYNLGLPRPGGGYSLDPKRDFFLPVNSLSQNEKSPTGNLTGDLKLIKNNDARDKISKAIYRNKKARIVFLMPDAVDHLHVKALEENQIQ